MVNSLSNFLSSIFWGSALIIFPLMIALLFVSKADRTLRSTNSF